MTTERPGQSHDGALVARYLATFDEPVVAARAWALGADGLAARLVEMSAVGANQIEADAARQLAEMSWAGEFSDFELFGLYASQNRAGLPDARLRAMTQEAEGYLLAAVEEHEAVGERLTENLRSAVARMRRALADGDDRAFHGALASLSRRARYAVVDAEAAAGLDPYPIVSVEALPAAGHARRALLGLAADDDKRLALGAFIERMGVALTPAESLDAWKTTASDVRDIVELEARRVGAVSDFIRVAFRPEAKLTAVELAIRGSVLGRSKRVCRDAAVWLLIDHHCNLAKLEKPRWTYRAGHAVGATVEFVSRAAAAVDFPIDAASIGYPFRRWKRDRAVPGGR